MSTTPDTSQVLRANVTDAELRELRARAARLGVTVPVLLAELVRRELATDAPEMDGGK